MNRRMKSRSSHYSRSNAEDDRRALLNYANKVDIFFFLKKTNYDDDDEGSSGERE
jgi:hypothetical protein